MTEYLLGLDQGSSNSKAVLVDQKGTIKSKIVIPLNTLRPRMGWVEHNPASILNTQITAAKRLLQTLDKRTSRISGIGITNQRSTLILWDKHSGKPLAPAISWQDLRAAEMLSRWKNHHQLIRAKTGLKLTPYYSAPKLSWLMVHIKGLRAKVDKGKVLCGTVNTYLIWHLTKGTTYATDHTNAARMLLMNLKDLSWDNDLLNLFDIPSTILPSIFPTVCEYGTTKINGRVIPIRSSIGDQQAGLLGIGAIGKGQGLLNYGTGGFFLINAGMRPILIPELLSSLAWTTVDKNCYLIEGTVNTVGTLFEFLSKLGLFSLPGEIDHIVKKSLKHSCGDIYFVPSLAGLGAPHWMSECRSAIFGIGPTTNREDIVRAALEGIAFLIKDIAEAIQKDGRLRINSLTASGGGSIIKSLVQFQANFLGISIRRTNTTEASGLGSALLAGVGCGWWGTPSNIPKTSKGLIFQPELSSSQRKRLYEKWKYSLRAAKSFTRYN